MKYFTYAIVVGIGGGLIGGIVGFTVLPRVIWRAYAMLYVMDGLQISVTYWAVLIGGLGGTLATVLATAAATIGTLRSPAANLMRPKAPKAGKRVILERVTPIWKRLKFSYKVTARNIFRNKKRFFMTLVGIAGCTAFLLTGFGIRDSIGGMVELQYQDITHAEVTAYLENPSGEAKDTPLNEEMKKYGKYAYYDSEDIEVTHGEKENKGMPTYLFVPEDAENLGKFITFRERRGRDPVQFPPKEQDGVVITEKLSEMLDIEVGDNINIGAPGTKKEAVKVSGITENYVYNYIYMTPEAYKNVFGADPEYATVMLKLSEEQNLKADGNYAQVLEDVVAQDNVQSATSVSQLREVMDNVVKSLNAIVYVVLAIAGLMALVVLYNLSNINITERERELATLRVLGFYKNEVSRYVNRETYIITAISILIGLAGGVVLHTYVMRSVEINEMMFGREVAPLSYIWSTLFTIACTIAMNIFMLPKIMKIDPATSLKSAE
jgi:putative ABC transport system permease protein